MTGLCADGLCNRIGRKATEMTDAEGWIVSKWQSPHQKLGTLQHAVWKAGSELADDPCRKILSHTQLPWFYQKLRRVDHTVAEPRPLVLCSERRMTGQGRESTARKVKCMNRDKVMWFIEEVDNRGTNAVAMTCLQYVPTSFY